MKRSPKVMEVALGMAAAVLIFLAVEGFNILPVLALGALGMLLTQSQTPRNFRPRLAPTAAATVQRLDFSDIGGQDRAKQELVEALDFMAQRERTDNLGIRPLKGILLTGPPGTGKTLLARAAASYTDSAFIAASGSEFVEMYAGVGAQRVRDLFRRAREAARGAGRRSAVVFVDEMEVLGGRRGAHSSHLEYDQTLNQLLVEMDGLHSHEGARVLVIGATNRPDMLDSALLRPGRFDRVVQVDLPDLQGRLSVLGIHARGKPLAADVDLEQVARETFGFSGAHLESLCNEAAIMAFRENCGEIHDRHVREAIDKVILGEKLDRRPRAEEKYRVAVHEAGHALVGEWVDPGSVSSITVTPRGRAMGYVRSHPGEDRYIYTREILERQIRIALAGAVAEEVVLASRSTGAQGDFEQAFDLARRIVRAGMSELGIVDTNAADGREGETISGILQEQEEAVRNYLAQRKEGLVTVAELVLSREALSGEEVREVLVNLPEPAVDHAAGPAGALAEPPAEASADTGEDAAGVSAGATAVSV